MAESESVTALADSNMNETHEIVTVSAENVIGDEVVTADILQQALASASEAFSGQNSDQYHVQNSVADGNVAEINNVTVSDALGSVVMTDASGATYTLVTTDEHDTEADVNELETMDGESQDSSAMLVERMDENSTNSTAMLPDPDAQDQTLVMNGQNIVEFEDKGPGEAEESVSQDAVLSEAPPIGSSDNPIRIIQQGNQYTSLQQLTQEQLQHIMQVVQQQQVLRSSQGGGGSSILYNPQTQTRIVYKVIYPSELHKNSGASPAKKKPNQLQIQIPTSAVTLESVPKRAYRKRKLEDDENADGPELSKEEKEERKKHRPRTRSGRVSKPPKHMVKDYKHIHPVDWDEDYDDSDGGYSDFKVSDEEEPERREERRHDINYTPYTLLGTGKAKNWKCDSCDKAYIGRAGLARHYRLLPSHGKLEDDPNDGNNSESGHSITSGVSSSSIPSHKMKQPSSNSSTSSFARGNVSVEVNNTRVPRTVTRMKQAYVMDNQPYKRKQKLKELVRQCDDEDLMEIVLPRLAKVITCWEFLVMKVEKGRPPKPHLSDILREYELLHASVKKLCEAQLVHSEQTDSTQIDSKSLGPNHIQITDESLAHSLGIETKVYTINDSPLKGEPVFQYKLLTSDPSSLTANPSQNAKKVVELVAPDKLLPSDNPAQRQKTHENVTNSVQSVKSNEMMMVSTIRNQTGIHRVSNANMQTTEEPVDSEMSNIEDGIVEHVAEDNLLDSDQDSHADNAIDPSSNIHPGHTITFQTSEPSSSPVISRASETSNELSTFVTSSADIHFNPPTVAIAKSEQQGAMVSILKNNLMDNQGDGSGISNNEMDTKHTIQVSESATDCQVTTAQIQSQIMEEGYVTGQVVEAQGIHVLQNGDYETQEILNNETTQVLIQDGDGLAQFSAEQDIMEGSQVMQTADGLILIRNPDGTIQIHGQCDQPIPLETVQALLAMDPTVQAEITDIEQG